MQAVNVNDGYLVFLPSDRSAPRRWDALYEMPHMQCGRMKPAPEGIEGTGSDRSGHHAVERRAVEHIYEVFELLHAAPVYLNRRIVGVAVLGSAFQCPFDPNNHEANWARAASASTKAKRSSPSRANSRIVQR